MKNLFSKNYWAMKGLALLVLVVMGGSVRGQTTTQNFGTGTGSHSSQTGSTSFIPAPSSGTTYARAGAAASAATINLVTASNPLGTTGAYLRAVASTTTSVTKMSPSVAYTGSTEFYTSFKVLFGDASAGSTATSGAWKFYQGAGGMYSDASDFSGAQVFTGLTFTYGAGGALELSYRGGGSNLTTGLTTTSFSSGIVYTIEIVGNNKTNGTISYTYNGDAQTVAVQKFDLYINRTLIGNDLSEAQLPANTSINASTFIGISSTSNVANIFVDDVVVYNSVPSTIYPPQSYTWNVSSGNWATAASWTPSRTSPNTNDILIFDGNTQATPTVTVDFTTSESIGQIKLQNNANVTLNTDGNRTLNIGASISGNDLEIPSGSTLNIQSTAATVGLTTNVVTGNTGSISGTVTTATSVSIDQKHQLKAADASGITFNSGGSFTAGLQSFSTNNPFGPSSGTLGSVIFANGSTFTQLAGTNPFAATAPNSIVTFNPSSTYVYKMGGTSAPSPGRTFGNFEFDATANGTITSGTETIAGNLIITSGTLSLGGTSSLSVGGNITIASGATLNYSPASSGAITLNGSSLQTISGSGTITLGTNANINVTNTTGVTFSKNITIGTGGNFTLPASGSGVYTFSAGNIFTHLNTTASSCNFNDRSITLKSDATGTASFGTFASTPLNATNITVERYIPALRKFRFLAAPVVGATAANWRNNGTNTAGIGTQITGGTVGNNFDQSTTNAASAFWYNEVNAGSDVTVGSGATSDPGWTAFANGNTEALTNGKGFRILVRGDRTISLDGTGSVTPTNTTLSVTGTYPANSVSIATTKTNSNTNSGFNLVGNPYPATIDWNTVTKGADISATYTTYNPNTGAFVSWNGTTGDASQYIASSQAFFVQQTGATGGITIAEANKATNTAGNYFRNKLADHLKVIMIYDSANYDAAFIHFRTDAQNDFDNYDGLKFQNAGVNIASVGSDGKRYNINSLASLTKTTEMPLSVLGSVLTNFELKFEDVESFKNHELYLIDNYLNKMLLLSNGYTYPISLSTDSASVKDGRFKIVFVQKATGINLNEKNANAFILYPNPAANAIHLLLNAKNNNNENVSFEIYNQLGAVIQFGNLDFTTAKDQEINIENLAQGSYFIKLRSQAQQQTIKFIK